MSIINYYLAMKILSISTILPIPGIVPSNDFLFQIYINYRQLYKDDTIIIIHPNKVNLNLRSVIKRKMRSGKLNKVLTRNIYDFQVEIFSYYSSWSLRNIHAIITSTVYLLNINRIKSLLSNYNFDIIHAQYIFPDGLLAYFLHKKYKIPYVITTHNERYYFDHTISRVIALRILKSACGVYPINYFNSLYYKSLGLTNIELIPLGFYNSFLKKQKELSKQRISIFTVAELIKLKNIDKVILAIGKLAPEYDITYTIIGKGPEKDNLNKLVDNLGINNIVHFIDAVPHELIANEMYKHDIFIMPSYFETFGRVYFEVMAMGIPIICAKNSGIFGIFKDREEGIAVDHNNFAEIINALKYLIDSPAERKRIGMNGKKLVENYTWENIAKLFHNKYDIIIHAENNH